MNRRFDICLLVQPHLSTEEKVELLETIIRFFPDEFRCLTEKSLMHYAPLSETVLPPSASLRDAVLATPDGSQGALFIDGLSTKGVRNVLSLSHESEFTEAGISLVFREVARLRKEDLRAWWLHLWTVGERWGIVVLGAGDELGIKENSGVVEQVRAWLDRFSLAFWVVAPTTLITAAGLPLKTETYEVVLQDTVQTMFENKHLEQRFESSPIGH